MADIEAWHLRAEDLNHRMLDKIASIGVEDLEVPGDAYLAPGDFNPLRTNYRIGEINYSRDKAEYRRWPRDPELAPRPLRIK